ncbi:transposase, partial [Lactobacillus crispatus]
LHRCFPKGKGWKDKAKAYVQQAADAINHIYRRILQYHTAEELNKQHISS